jgi:hypothetical protein
MGLQNVDTSGGSRVPHTVEPSVLAALSCSLPPAAADARRTATARLFAKAVRCDWTSDGARVLFHGSTEMAREVMEFVLAERICCAELTYHVATMPPHDHLALVMRGPSELRDAIRAWVGEER